jgi:hypothetical protein
MKNLVNKLLALSVILYLWQYQALAQSKKINNDLVTGSSEFKIETSRVKISNLQLFDNQTFVDSRTGVIYAAGFVLNKPTEGRMDCFVYIQPKGAAGSIVFGSERTESAWDCVGSPAIGLRDVFDGKSKRSAVFAIFNYRAPGGEIFKYPFAIALDQTSKHTFGELQVCVERYSERVELKDLRQVASLASKCQSKK